MFDISLPELLLLGICTGYVVGRKELPRASKTIGSQLGRVVGLIQGARARADRFATDNQLSKLQSELRTGLRQLDAVKAEMAMLTTQGVVGRGLRMDGGGGVDASKGMVAGGSKSISSNLSMSHAAVAGGTIPSPSAAAGVTNPLTTTSSATSTAINPTIHLPPPTTPHPPLAPRSHSVAAIAEEEWVNRGIGFKSRAESGGGDTAGAGVLADVFQQSLIFDQYQRVMEEQNEALQKKVDDKVEERRRLRSAEEKKRDEKNK